MTDTTPVKLKATKAVKLKATKAVVGAIVAGLIAGLGIVAADLANPATDWASLATWIPIIVATLVGSGVTGKAVFETVNAPVA